MFNYIASDKLFLNSSSSVFIFIIELKQHYSIELYKVTISSKWKDLIFALWFTDLTVATTNVQI